MGVIVLLAVASGMVAGVEVHFKSPCVSVGEQDRPVLIVDLPTAS